MEEFWNTVKPLFDKLKLRISWHTQAHYTDPDVVILITEIRDVDGDDFIQSQFPIRLSHADFRADGARFSYWRRMNAIALSGLITTDDVAAEEYQEKPRAATQQKAKPETTKPQTITW